MMTDFWDTYLACKKGKAKSANAYRVAKEDHRELCKWTVNFSGDHAGSEGKGYNSGCERVYFEC